MAFTETQKVALRTYMAFPLGYYDLNTRFESMMDKVGASAEEQAMVELIMAQIVVVEATLATTSSTVTATGALAKVDEMEWHPPTSEATSSTIDARQRGKMLLTRLSKAFGLGNYRSTYFSVGGGWDGELALG